MLSSVRHSARSFVGLRDAVLTRDHFRCQVCAAGQQPVVHHRQPGRHALPALVTLCPACHAVVHKLAAHRHWLPEPLATLWHEQHPGVPLQLQLEMRFADNEAERVAAGREAGGGDLPARSGGEARRISRKVLGQQNTHCS